MNTKGRNTLYTLTKRTWFGANAVVEVPPGHFHRAGYGRFLIYHPGLVNWLLRIGLPEDARCRLVAAHELGHLQSFPLEMVYAVILFGIAISGENSSPGELAIILISCFATWEIFAESYSLIFEHRLYRVSYRDISLLPRTIFWLLAILLSLAGWSVTLN